MQTSEDTKAVTLPSFHLMHEIDNLNLWIGNCARECASDFFDLCNEGAILCVIYYGCDPCYDLLMHEQVEMSHTSKWGQCVVWTSIGGDSLVWRWPHEWASRECPRAVWEDRRTCAGRQDWRCFKSTRALKIDWRPELVCDPQTWEFGAMNTLSEARIVEGAWGFLKQTLAFFYCSCCSSGSVPRCRILSTTTRIRHAKWHSFGFSISFSGQEFR